MRYTDIELTQEEIESITRYKTFGQKWIDDALDYEKANKYLTEVCNREATSWNAGRCYNKGNTIYTRKDGEAIRLEDFEALQLINHGQCNKYTIAEDGMSMNHYWECDSGD